jgi:hypothetical protein
MPCTLALLWSLLASLQVLGVNSEGTGESIVEAAALQEDSRMQADATRTTVRRTVHIHGTPAAQPILALEQGFAGSPEE